MTKFYFLIIFPFFQKSLQKVFTTYFLSISTFLPPFITVCSWLLWYNIQFNFIFILFICFFIFYNIFLFFNIIFIIIELESAVVAEVAPSILPLTFMLILYPYTFPPLHTLPSFIPADHKITHQWRGNPHSWDSIYQHQRKPERLLVKLLTNTFNTKDSHLGALRCSFVWCWVSSLKTFVNRAFLGSSWKVSGSLIVTAKVHRGFQIWNPSGRTSSNV